MKRVEIERQAIHKALNEQPNITLAARVLGASRRTLQARMRDYDIPRGQAGRPRELLPKKRQERDALAAGLGEGLLFVLVAGVGVWLLTRPKGSQSVVGVRDASGRPTTDSNPYLRGALIQAA